MEKKYILLIIIAIGVIVVPLILVFTKPTLIPFLSKEIYKGKKEKETCSKNSDCGYNLFCLKDDLKCAKCDACPIGVTPSPGVGGGCGKFCEWNK